MSTRILVAMVFVAVLTFPAAEADAASKCTALKYKLAGRAALAKAKCKADAAKNGVEASALCLTKADAALTQKWNKAEKKGDCVGTNDLGATQAAIDAFVAEAMEALEPPPATCCDLGDSCFHGEQFVDAAACVQFGGTAGAPGTVCDGVTGSCGPPPAGTGQCCFLPDFNVCNGGPSIDLAGCVSAGGLDYPFAATCLPSGFCSFDLP